MIKLKLILFYITFIFAWVRPFDLESFLSIPEGINEVFENNHISNSENTGEIRDISNDDVSYSSFTENINKKLKRDLHEELDYIKISEEYLKSVTSVDFKIIKCNVLKDNNLVSIHFYQVIKDITVINTYAVVNVNYYNGSIISSRYSFFNETTSIDSVQDMKEMLCDIVNSFIKYLGYENNKGNQMFIDFNEDDNVYEVFNDNFMEVNIKLKLCYIVNEGKANIIVVLSLKENDNFKKYIYIKSSNEFYELNDNNGITMNVVPLTNNNILEGTKIIYNPESLDYSPQGWNRENKIYYEVTIGNNVRVIRIPAVGISTSSSMNSQGLFNHYYDYKRGINDSNNTDFILDNIFYVMNMAHDMFAFAGFDEKEKNMQTYYFNYNNQERNYYSKGGNLHVTLNHNKKFENGSNNICESTYDTNFKESKITLGTFFVNGEVRSSGLDNGVLIHEYTHLVFEHLVKNDEGFNCSFNRESECLNEGTADFFAEAFHYKKTNNKNDEYVIGKYLNITRYAVISSDKNVSPLHYGDFNYRNGNSKYKYLGGAIWHSMLHDALYNLCEKYNCEEITSDKIRRYENDEEPPMNYLFMKYIIEALKLTGCQPTFLQLRNEILNLSLSDKNIKNNKDVYCRIYAGFANRYFGVDAEKIRISSNDRAVLAAGNVSSKLPSLCGNDYDYLIENI